MAKAAYRKTVGWKAPASRGTVSRPTALPKPSPVKDPGQDFRSIGVVGKYIT